MRLLAAGASRTFGTGSLLDQTDANPRIMNLPAFRLFIDLPAGEGGHGGIKSPNATTHKLNKRCAFSLGKRGYVRQEKTAAAVKCDGQVKGGNSLDGTESTPPSQKLHARTVP